MKPKWLYASVLIMCSAPLTVTAEDPNAVDILQIFDRFAVSNAAAAKCYQPEKDLLTKFKVNYLNVLIRSQMRLKEMYPDATDVKIQQAIKSRADNLSNHVVKMVEEKGCEDEAIQELITLFQFHANWSPMQKPSSAN